MTTAKNTTPARRTWSVVVVGAQPAAPDDGVDLAAQHGSEELGQLAGSFCPSASRVTT